jgi:hypothetical protein
LNNWKSANGKIQGTQKAAPLNLSVRCQNNEKINGAKTWMLVYSDGNASEKLRNNPVLYRAATDKMVQKLFPKEKLEAMEDGDLSYTCPPNDEIYAGCFEGGAVGVPLSQQRSLEVTIRQNLTVAS